jgi:hypothetical protein
MTTAVDRHGITHGPLGRPDLFASARIGTSSGFATLLNTLTPAQVDEAVRVACAKYPPEGYGTTLRTYDGQRVIEWGGCE